MPNPALLSTAFPYGIRRCSPVAERTIALSGGVRFSAEHISTSDGSGFVEWTSTSITSPNLDVKMGFMVVEAGPQSASCQWWFVDTVRELSEIALMGHQVVIPAHPVGRDQHDLA